MQLETNILFTYTKQEMCAQEIEIHSQNSVVVNFFYKISIPNPNCRLFWLVGLKFNPTHKSNYFLPCECFAGSEICFFCFLFRSFSRCNFLCCSKPAVFFSLLDKTSST